MAYLVHLTAIWVLFVTFGVQSRAQNVQDVLVELSNGNLIGSRLQVTNDSSVDRFLGVPYARPPIGELRFQKPVPFVGTFENRSAQKWAPICYQDTSDVELVEPKPSMSEDCLYLNVWRPSKMNSTNPRPVLVFFHGGGYGRGSPAETTYDGGQMSARGDVLVVTVAFRLGALGFLYGGRGDDLPGNAGLWDQVLALRWVRDNVSKFGGDPTKVTIFGQSSGGMSVSLHVLSKSSRGLFHRAVAMSGSALSPGFVNCRWYGIEKARNLVKVMGCPVEANATKELDLTDEQAKCLREVSPEKLVQVASKDIQAKKDRRTNVRYQFVPVQGPGLFIEDWPKNLVNGEQYDKNVNLMVGVTDDEGASLEKLLLAMNITAQEDFQKYLEDEIERRVPFKSNLTMDQKAEITDFYFAGTGSCSERKRKATYDAIYDLTLVCPTLIFGTKLAKDKNSSITVNSYVFSYKSKSEGAASDPKTKSFCSKDQNGACHNYELQFLFGRPFDSDRQMSYDEDDRKVSTELIEAFSGFAANGPKGLNWPQYKRCGSTNIVGFTPRFDFNPTKLRRLTSDFKRSVCDGIWWKYLLH